MKTAFDGVSIVPMDRDQVIHGQTVVVDGDRVAWIGPEADAQVPADAVRIPAHGKYLMPGLADMHCHPVAEDDLVLLVAHGVTTIRNMEGMPRHVLWREQVSEGQRLGPSIHTTGPIVDGRPTRANWMQSVADHAEAVAAAELTKRGKYDAVKVYDQLSVDAYGWLVDAARERDLPLYGHVPFQVGLETVLESGQRSVEHLYGYHQALQPRGGPAATPPRLLHDFRDWMFEMARSADLALLPEVAEATRAAETWNSPTLLVRTRWLADPEQLRARPEMRYVSPPVRAEWAYFAQNYPKDSRRSAVPELNAAIVRALSEAGAGLLAGTDAGAPNLVYGASMHEELQAMVDAGLSPFQALRSATYDAAVFLEENGEWGEVSVGARADLLLLDANPLADIANTARLAGVMARGRWLPRAELASLLDGVAARASEPTARDARVASSSSLPPGSERLLFDVQSGRSAVGSEDIVCEPTRSGRRRVLATSDIDSLRTEVAWEKGVYRATVSVDPAGVDQDACFEYDGPDGPNRVEMTRSDGQVRVHHVQAVEETDVEFADPGSTALFGRPLTVLYLRLAERLADLAVGESRDVRVIGPGLPPDLKVDEATLHATRLPDTGDDDGARYAVDFQRANATMSTLLVCDRDNRPVRLDRGSDIGYWLGAATAGEIDPESMLRVARR